MSCRYFCRCRVREQSVSSHNRKCSVDDGDEHAYPGVRIERLRIVLANDVTVVVVLLTVDGPIGIEGQDVRRGVAAGEVISHHALTCPPRPRVRKVSPALGKG